MTLLEFIDKHPWWSFFALLLSAQLAYGLIHLLTTGLLRARSSEHKVTIHFGSDREPEAEEVKK